MARQNMRRVRVPNHHRKAPPKLSLAASSNFGVKLSRPVMGPAAELLHHRQGNGVTAVQFANCSSNFSAATAAPLQLRHASPPNLV
jgi:hypothetical protein